VTSGLAWIKFSVSPNKNGKIRQIKERLSKRSIIPRKSLKVKKGWKEILLKFEFNPIGLLEPD
jgi:hypothetical protein